MMLMLMMMMMMLMMLMLMMTMIDRMKQLPGSSEADEHDQQVSE